MLFNYLFINLSLIFFGISIYVENKTIHLFWVISCYVHMLYLSRYVLNLYHLEWSSKTKRYWYINNSLQHQPTKKGCEERLFVWTTILKIRTDNVIFVSNPIEKFNLIIHICKIMFLQNIFDKI